MASSITPTIEQFFHSALELSYAAASHDRANQPREALFEYRRVIAIIEHIQGNLRDRLSGEIDEVYLDGLKEVEVTCRLEIAKLEELIQIPRPQLVQQGKKFPQGPRENTMPSNVIFSSIDHDRQSVPFLEAQQQLSPTKTKELFERRLKERTPSPEKGQKKSMPMSLRPNPPGRQSSDSSAPPSGSNNSITYNPTASVATSNSSASAAAAASFAASLAWQSKKHEKLPMTNGSARRLQSSGNGRGESLEYGQQRPYVPDCEKNESLLDTPLIYFSDPPVIGTASLPEQRELGPGVVDNTKGPARIQRPQKSNSSSRRNVAPPIPPPHRKPLFRSNAISSIPSATTTDGQVKSVQSPSKPITRSVSAPETQPPPQAKNPIAISIPPEAERSTTSREDAILCNLPPGVEPALAKIIMNDIVIRSEPVQWSDIAGLEEAKASLRETVIYPFLRPDLFSGLREPARGILLFGPPGTGKTMLAKALASQAKSTFFSVSASSLVSKYLGESEKLVKALFSLAKALSPSIIFVDEIDSLLSSRSDGSGPGGSEHEASRRLKTEFLIQWSSLASAAADRAGEDGVEKPRVLVLAATNLPWQIDDAARRRFVLRQYIPLPEGVTRGIQLKRLLGRQSHNLSESEIGEIVQMTEGFSGSDITALAKDAAMGPIRSLGESLLTTKAEEIRPIGFEDFMQSLRKIRPSVSRETLTEFDRWNDEFGSKG